MKTNPRESVRLERGSTTSHACQYDQRFSYYAYIPSGYDEASNQAYPLAVIVHGHERAAQAYRSAFKDFAEATNTIILAPLFPCGIIDPDDVDNYKFIKFHDIRFDHVLLAMVEELGRKYRIQKDKFLLHGFSGGGQFVHRFYYLHPDRLMGVSIGAPGRLTFLDDAKPWFAGTRNFEEQFGKAIELELLRQVPVQVVVGKEDTGLPTPNPKYDAFLEGQGESRKERSKRLADHYESKGISVQYDEVDGVAHHGIQILPPVKEFFAKVLAAR